MTETTAAPTVALVHGAFADSSCWNDVVRQLLAAGVRVRAIPNPLRGISHDAAYVASALQQIPGPVLAVGHSYGGAVLTNAAPKADNVVGLVYVAAFAPDEGETLQDIEADSRDSVLLSALQQFQYPTGTPAWRTLRSWAVVPSGDKAVGSDVVRRMAERAGATIVQAEGSHVIMISQPKLVTDVIRQALEAVA